MRKGLTLLNETGFPETGDENETQLNETAFSKTENENETRFVQRDS